MAAARPCPWAGYAVRPAPSVGYRSPAAMSTQTAQESIRTYIRAKDENRPHLMKYAFAEEARLEMVVKTGTISFPPLATGLESITDVLVRRFAQSFENVYTFCLAPPPQAHDAIFSCKWLVGMSEKETRRVRVGCGRYDWLFQSKGPRLAQRLTITIELMQVLPPERLPSVIAWLS